VLAILARDGGRCALCGPDRPGGAGRRSEHRLGARGRDAGRRGADVRRGGLTRRASCQRSRGGGPTARRPGGLVVRHRPARRRAVLGSGASLRRSPRSTRPAPATRRQSCSSTSVPGSSSPTSSATTTRRASGRRRRRSPPHGGLWVVGQHDLDLGGTDIDAPQSTPASSPGARHDALGRRCCRSSGRSSRCPRARAGARRGGTPMDHRPAGKGLSRARVVPVPV